MPCPACRESGHDKTGDHLIVFEDGNAYCNRSRYHATGLPYFSSDGENPAMTSEITGDIKYTPDQFKELIESGMIDNPGQRILALSGMKQEHAWEVMSGTEREILELDWTYDLRYFEKLKVRNLISRHIRGEYAKLYNVRTGVDEEGKVDRHFYPVYSGSRLTGAICRTLPKDFRFNRLGKTWGKTDLFGMHITNDIAKTGRRFDSLLLVGGHCDALAAQQMLCESQKGTKWGDVKFHICSVNNGEHSIEEIIRSKDYINRFKRVIVAFDDDDVGNAFCKDVGRLFRDKAVKLPYPEGYKDPNACLIHKRHSEFVDGFFNPIQIFGGGNLKRVSDIKDKAKKQPVMGLSWPWDSLNWMTFGIRPYSLHVLGGGTGVGKTEMTKEIVDHLTMVHEEVVGVIYLEEQTDRTVRSFAGKAINKRLEDPSVNDPNDSMYSEARDYTKEQADTAIDDLSDINRLVIADTGGSKHIDTVMELIEEFLVSGITKIIVDNLTAIEIKGKGSVSKVEAIDEAMKRIGTFKDEKPVTIFLLSHLTRPRDPRIPHEKGGEVFITDFRGSGSISFWANGVFGIERNTTAETKELQRLTVIRCVKSRDNGMAPGNTVNTLYNPNTGRIRETEVGNIDTSEESRECYVVKDIDAQLLDEHEPVPGNCVMLGGEF